MTYSDNFRFNPNYINIYLSKIISYLPLAESSTYHFYVTKLVALSTGKVKSNSTSRLVMIFLAFVCHCIRESFSGFYFLLAFPLQSWNYIHCPIIWESFKLRFKLIMLFSSRGRLDPVVTHWERAQYRHMRHRPIGRELQKGDRESQWLAKHSIYNRDKRILEPLLSLFS